MEKQVENKNDRYLDPNRYARSFSMKKDEDYLEFHGYQEFKLFKDHLEILDIDESLQKKSMILRPFMINHNLTNRSLMDLGANSGYFCYMALQNGAEKTIALEMDEEYCAGLQKAKKVFSLEKLEVISENFDEIDFSADFVIALAFIHWVYSCTANYGSLEKIIKKLADSSNYALIVEWIAPDDPAIQYFDHLNWNQDVIEEKYTFELFQKALNKYFKRSKLIGEVSPTRKIFIAYKTENNIYMDSPLPRLEGKRLISSQLLAINNNIDYWSDVYDDGEFIYKLATKNMAAREAEFLEKFDSPFFPKVFDVQQFDDYSKIKIEKIHGMRIQEYKYIIEQDRERINKFIDGCFDLLEQLQKEGITHRDIRNENILVRDDLPVLIDFGWAITTLNQVFTPEDLGQENRPPDNLFCDSYSIGFVIAYLNNDQYNEIADLTKLLTTPDDQYRITDINILREIFDHLKSKRSNDTSYNLTISLRSYIELVDKSSKIISQNIQLSKEKEQIIQELRIKIDELEQKVQFYSLSKSWKITKPLRKIMRFLKGN